MQIEIPEALVGRISKLCNGHTAESYTLKLLKKAIDDIESASVITYAFDNDRKAFINAVNANDAIELYRQLHPAYPKDVIAKPATPAELERMRALGVTPSWTKSAKQFKSK